MSKNENSGGDSEESSVDLELSDIFYTSHKKGHVFRVKLNARGFILKQESNAGTKCSVQTVSIADIVGGRCMRVKKSHRLGGTCGSCSSSSMSATVATRSDNENNEKHTDAQCTSDLYENGDSSAYLYVFAYVLKKNLRQHLRRERTVLTLRFRSFDSFEENMREAECWYKTLRELKNICVENLMSNSFGGYEYQRRRLLVFLNPKSGCGKAREQFNHQVALILNEAEVPYDLHVTKHANYARDFVRLRNLSLWSGVVAVGGDGLFFEILNGLLQRSDWESTLQHLSLGVVPCGSGNGLAKSIAHLFKEPYEPKPILCAALTIVSGRSAPMDVVRIQMQNQTLYSFLSVGWGLISDIDIESERLRALGYQRFTLWTLHRLINLRTYRGRITYLLKEDTVALATESASSSKAQNSHLQHSKSCSTYLNQPENYSWYRSFEFIGSHGEFEDVISLETSGKQSLRSRCDSWLSVGSRKSTYYSIPESIYHSIADESDFDVDEAAKCHNNSASTIEMHIPRSTTKMPPLSAPLPDNWIVEEGDFVMVHAVYQSHLSTDCYFAPVAHLNDGTIYLVIIRAGISRAQLLNFLINMSSGTHLPTSPNDFIKVVATTAFRIEPHANKGIITVDGERVEFGALQGEVCPGVVNVMVPK